LSETGKLLRFKDTWEEILFTEHTRIKTIDFMFPIANGKLVIADSAGPIALIDEHITPLANDETINFGAAVSEKEVWLGDGQGDLLIVDSSVPGGLRKLALHTAQVTGSRKHPVDAILATRDGKRWVGTLGRQIGAVDAATGLWAPQETAVPVMKLLEGQDGGIWIGSRGRALLLSIDNLRYSVDLTPGAQLRSVLKFGHYRTAIGTSAGVVVLNSDRPALNLVSSFLLVGGMAHLRVEPQTNDHPDNWRIFALDSAEAGALSLSATEIARRGKALSLDSNFEARWPTSSAWLTPHYITAVAVDRMGTITRLGENGRPQGPLWRVPDPVSNALALIPASAGVLAASWLVLLVAYPRSQTAQALLFSSDVWRRVLSFWAFDVAVFAVPALGRYLLRPFHDNLLAGAQIDRAQLYYDKLTVVELSTLSTQPVAKPISTEVSIVSGRTLLIGRSGSGKTHFLRKQLEHTKNPAVFLEAKSCVEGVLEKIRHRFPNYVRDSGLFEKILYAGRLAIVIDGLNEVDVDTRSKIDSFILQFPKAPIVITCQPMSWRPGLRCKVFEICPIGNEEIVAFFESIGYSDDTFRIRLKEFLREVSDTHDPLRKFLIRDILSTPHDLALIGLLLRNGRKPDVSDLQQQQLELAEDALQKRIGRGLNLGLLCSKAFDARLNNSQDSAREFDPSGFEAAELDVLCESRILILIKDGRSYYQFRHDRIQDFLIVLDPDNRARAEAEHQDDIRFAGVFALMAERLPKSRAKELLASLAATASQTGEFGVLTLMGRRLRELERAEAVSAASGIL
jgi:hypothetical protein